MINWYITGIVATLVVGFIIGCVLSRLVYGHYMQDTSAKLRDMCRCMHETRTLLYYHTEGHGPSPVRHETAHNSELDAGLEATERAIEELNNDLAAHNQTLSDAVRHINNALGAGVLGGGYLGGLSPYGGWRSIRTTTTYTTPRPRDPSVEQPSQARTTPTEQREESNDTSDNDPGFDL